MLLISSRSTSNSMFMKGCGVFQEPVLFMKPTSSYLRNGGTIEIPHPLESLDHEVELAVVIGRKARDVSESSAMDYVGGTCVAILWPFCLDFENLAQICKVDQHDRNICV